MKKSDVNKAHTQAAQTALHQNHVIANKRRQFLSMVTKSGISAKLLRATPLVAGIMANRFAQANEAETKRVIFLYFPGGAPNGTWMPADINTMNRSTAPYQNLAKYCNFYSALVLGGGSGGTQATLGGRVSNSTFDVQLAGILGATSPFSRINLSVETNNSSDLLSKKDGMPVWPLNDPQTAYSHIFGGAASNTTTYTKQKLALDANLAGLNSLKSQLGADEKIRLETHTDAIAMLQQELEKTQKSACNRPVLPSSTDAINDIAKTLRMQMDIAVTALQCGLTNVASIQFSNSQADWLYKGSFEDTHHSTAHGRPQNDLIEIMNYLGKNGVYLIERLLNTEDSNGKKLIDSTVFVQVSGEGDITNHSITDAPFIVASKIPTFKAGTVGLRGSNITLLNDIAKGLGITTLTDFNSDMSSGILV